MLKDVRFFSAPARLLRAFMLTASIGSVCSIIYPVVQAGPNVHVSLVDRGHPAAGVQLKLSGPEPGAIWTTAITDANGSVFFHDLAPGDYGLGPDHDAGIPDGVGLHVEPSGTADVTVTLKWPSTAPISVRALKGKIHLPGGAQPEFSLDLLEAISGRMLKSAETKGSGQFGFENLSPALYFLNLQPSPGLGGKFTGQIVVEVNPAAPAEQLDLDLAWSGCGLSYIDRNQCPPSDLKIERLSGSVRDASGASVGKADLLLLGRDETAVERLTSDYHGKFTSPLSLDGTYRLLVTSPGFSPLTATVHAHPGAGQVAIELGVMGSCSTAKQELR